MPNIRRNTSLLFLVFFLFYYIGITLFIHTHTIDGRLITHSHPYQSDAQGNPLHSHSCEEITLIHALNQFLGLAIFAFLGLRKLQALHSQKHFLTKTSDKISDIVNLYFSRRGPPLVS